MIDDIIRTNVIINVAAMYHHPATRPLHNGGVMMFGILSRKASGIYEIRNTINGHCYIGSAVDMKRRWREHQSYLHRNKHHSQHLQHAWNKYGEACFRFSIIEKCDSALVIEREQFYIDTLRPEYNIVSKAGSNFGMKHSEEARLKMSVARKGKPLSIEVRQKISESNKGKTYSEETRRKMSQAHNKAGDFKKGHVVSEEMREKISKALTGRIFSEEWRRKLSNRMKGVTVSDETRRKISKANKGRVVSEETRRKLSDKGKAAWSNGGKRHDAEDEK